MPEQQEAEQEQQEQAEQGKTFDQDAVNRIVEDRLARERKRFEDYDDLRAKAEQFDQLEAEKLSELEKAQQAIAERDARLSEFEQRETQRARAEVITEAARKANFLDPTDAVAHLGTDVDVTDDQALGKALADLADRKKHLVASRGTGDAGAGREGAGDGTVNMNDRIRAQMRRGGV